MQSEDVVWEKLEGAPEGGKGMAARCPRVEDGGDTKKDCLGLGARALALTVTFPQWSSSLASSPRSFVALYEMWPITCSHWWWGGDSGLDPRRGLLDGCARHCPYLQEDLTVGSL